MQAVSPIAELATPAVPPQIEEPEVLVLASRKEIFALEAEYAELYASLPDPNVYFSPEFVYSWLVSLGRPHEPRFITCRIGGRLVGVWPFFECKLRMLGTSLLPVGAHAADLFDPVGTPESMEPLVRGLLALNRSYAFTWVLLVSRAFAQDVLQPQMAATRSRCILRQRTPRFVVELKKFTDFQGYMETVFGPKTRQGLRRKYRKLAELGSAEFLSLDKPQDIASWLPAVVDLDARSPKGQRGDGIFHKARTRAFYQLLLENMASKGRARLGILAIDGRLAAYEIGFTGQGSYCMHNMAYDPEFGECSPGRLLMLDAVERLMAEGFAAYDFMQNDQEFKRQMSTSESRLWDLIVFPKTLRGFLIHRAVKWTRAWQKWRKGSEGKTGSLERNDPGISPGN